MPAFNYFLHTVNFSILRIGQKFLEYDMSDEALLLAVKTNHLLLMKFCRNYAKRKKDVILLHIVDLHLEKVNPGQ